MEMIIRNALIDDSAAIAEISRSDLGYDCSEMLVRNKLENIDNKREAVFVAAYGDDILGFVHVEQYSTLYSETLANILGIAVKDEWRRQGVGSYLMGAAEDWAADICAAGVRLNSGASRLGAHEFYRARGYNSEKQQIRFIKSF